MMINPTGELQYKKKLVSITNISSPKFLHIFMLQSKQGNIFVLVQF
jgi:hypothetical protein